MLCGALFIGVMRSIGVMMTTPMGCSEMTGWRARFVKIQGSKMAMHQASRRNATEVG